MSWNLQTVGGHPVDVFRPERVNEHGYVVLYLHGVHLGSLRDHPPFVEQFARHGLPVVCPHGGRCWWLDRICPDFDPRITPERHLRENIVPFLREEFGATPPKIALLGTSMGGQGALRMAYKQPDMFPIVAALAPAIDFHLRINEGDEVLGAMFDEVESARQHTALLYIHPLNWPRRQFFCCDPADYRWFESVERLRMKLASLGVPFECDLESTAGGHGFGYYNHMAEKAVGFLVDSLHRERLRVPN